MTKMLTRVALLAVLCMVGGNTVLAQLQSGRIVGTIFDTAARGHPGRNRHRHERGDEPVAKCSNRFAGQLRRHAARPRHLQRERGDVRLPDDRQERARADRRTGGPSRAGDESRRAVDGSAGDRRDAAAQYRIGDVERGHHQRADRGSSAERQRLPRAGAPHVGRGAAAADRQHAARPPRGRQRQRHRRRRRLADAVSPRRRGHHGRASGGHLDSDLGRRAAGVQRVAECVLGRIPRRRRHVQRDDQVGRQRLSRKRVRVHAQRRVRLEELLRRQQREARAQSVRRHARRSGDDPGDVRRAEQDLLLRELRGASAAAGCGRRHQRAVGRAAPGRFQRPRADFRSADAPRLSEASRRARSLRTTRFRRTAFRRRRSSSCGTSRCRMRLAIRTCRTRSRRSTPTR